VALITRASEIKYRPIEWLWPGRIACSKLSLLAGAPGSGKSALVASIIAAVTTGGAYPCGEGRAPQGSVVLVCPDGDPDVLVPRLQAAGADLARVQIIREVQGANGPRPFDVATDLPVLDAALRPVKDLRLILIDALCLPTGRGATQASRTLLDLLAKLAQAHHLAVMAVLRKPAGFDALEFGPARTGFLVELDPADKQRRLLLQMKNELAPDRGTLAFHVTGRDTGSGQIAARVAFEPQHHPLSAPEFIARQRRTVDSAKADAIEFLHSLFGSATQLKVHHIEHEARGAGLLRANQALTQCRTLRDARMAMGLEVTREGFESGAWVWAKPDTQKPGPQARGCNQPDSLRKPAVETPRIKPGVFVAATRASSAQAC
jgi:putative DNA primase/helicase